MGKDKNCEECKKQYEKGQFDGQKEVIELFRTILETKANGVRRLGNNNDNLLTSLINKCKELREKK